MDRGGKFFMNKLIRRKLRNDPTPQEIIMWSRLRRKQCGAKFRRQHSIGKYIIDFYCPKLRLAIEIDGWQHKEEFSGVREIQRTQYFEQNNIKVLRF
jgi:very-short-patch-repair endonuclease